MKKYLLLLLSLLLVFSLAACGTNSESNGGKDSVNGTGEIEDSVSTGDGEDVEGSQLAVQSVDKSEIGITMSLSSDYSDCEISDLGDNVYSLISDKAIGGFNINKEIDGHTYTLSTVAVVESSVTSTPEERSKYPYIFAGTEYSVVATLPVVDTSDMDVYEKVNQLQSGIMQQLCTIFFDESVLLGSSETDTSVVEPVPTPEVDVSNTENVENTENTENVENVENVENTENVVEEDLSNS